MKALPVRYREHWVDARGTGYELMSALVASQERTHLGDRDLSVLPETSPEP